MGHKLSYGESHVSKVFERRVVNILSQEFSRLKSQSLGALSKLDKLLLSWQVSVQSGTFRKFDKESQDLNEDCSQNDAHSEIGTSVNWSLQFMISVPKEVSYMATRVHERILYCILEISSGQQKFVKLFLTPRRKHPCYIRSRPNSVCPSTTGEQLQCT